MSGPFVFGLGGFVTRREVARVFGINEGTLRTAEANGTLPPFSPESAGEYVRCVHVWQAARRGGASTQAYRGALERARAEGEEFVEKTVREDEDSIEKLFA